MTTTATNNKSAWLGNYPAHWENVPVWALFDDNKIKNEHSNETNVLSLSYGNIIKRDVESNLGLLPESFDTYQIVKAGNIILRLTDLQNDKKSLRVGLAKENGIITSAYTGLVLKYKNCVVDFFYYALHALDLMKYFYSLGGGVRQSIGYRELKWLKLPVPLIEEQNQIVEYIKTQSQKINHFIAKKQQFIALLKEQRQSVINEAVTKGINKKVKLKDSGIKWLGNIPEHWVVRRLKNIAKICNGSECDKKDEGLYPVFGSGGIFGRYDEFLYDKPSVLLGRKGTVDKPILVNEPFWTVDTAFYTKIEESVSTPEYFFYLCTTINFDLYSTKTALPSMTQTDLYKVKFAIPPLLEQTQIINHIKTETATIDTAIAKTERELELIKEYKEAMIAEAVMGKVNFNKTVNAQ